MSSVYAINKGINRPIEFRGLKAQYIYYLAGGLLGLLLLFAVVYICGVNLYACVVVIGGLGAGLFFLVFRLSHKFGQYGLMKRAARRRLPALIRFGTRDEFLGLADEKRQGV